VQADLKKARSQVEGLQTALAASKAEAEEAKAGSDKALSPLEDALKQACNRLSGLPLSCSSFLHP